MDEEHSDTMQFDILLKSAGSGTTPRVENIARFRPPPEHVEKCRRWLESKGIVCHPTGFGFVCTAPVRLFETLFSTEVERTESASGAPPWRCSSAPEAPDEIREYVDQVSIAAPPELF